MLNCKQASRLVSQSLDRKLNLRERFKLWLHLLLCDACRQFSRQLHWLRTALRRFTQQAENDVTVRLSGEARQRMLSALHRHE